LQSGFTQISHFRSFIGQADCTLGRRPPNLGGGAGRKADQEDRSIFGQADRSGQGSKDKTPVPEIVSPPDQGQRSVVPEQSSQQLYPDPDMRAVSRPALMREM
jgi:hypothetical protein